MCSSDLGPHLSADRRGRQARRAGSGALAPRVVRGLGIYLAVVGPIVGFIVASHLQGPRPVVWILAAGAAFAAFCLIDLARADQVRYLPKWAWAVACLISIPLGGIMYLTVGRVRRGNPREQDQRRS